MNHLLSFYSALHGRHGRYLVDLPAVILLLLDALGQLYVGMVPALPRP